MTAIDSEHPVETLWVAGVTTLPATIDCLEGFSDASAEALR